MRWAALALASALGACAHAGAPQAPKVTPLIATPIVMTPPRTVQIVVAPRVHCANPAQVPLPDVSAAPDIATAFRRMRVTIRRQADFIRNLTAALKACARP